MHKEDVERVIDQINCKDWGLELGDNRASFRSAWFVRVRGYAPEPGRGIMQPYVGRKWLLARFCTPSQIVRLCFDAIREAEEELIREAFHYRGAAIYGPLVDVDRMASLMSEHDGAHGVDTSAA